MPTHWMTQVVLYIGLRFYKALALAEWCRVDCRLHSLNLQIVEEGKKVLGVSSTAKYATIRGGSHRKRMKGV